MPTFYNLEKEYVVSNKTVLTGTSNFVCFSGDIINGYGVQFYRVNKVDSTKEIIEAFDKAGRYRFFHFKSVALVPSDVINAKHLDSLTDKEIVQIDKQKRKIKLEEARSRKKFIEEHKKIEIEEGDEDNA